MVRTVHCAQCVLRCAVHVACAVLVQRVCLHCSFFLLLLPLPPSMEHEYEYEHEHEALLGEVCGAACRVRCPCAGGVCVSILLFCLFPSPWPAPCAVYRTSLTPSVSSPRAKLSSSCSCRVYRLYSVCREYPTQRVQWPPCPWSRVSSSFVCSVCLDGVGVVYMYMCCRVVRVCRVCRGRERV